MPNNAPRFAAAPILLALAFPLLTSGQPARAAATCPPGNDACTCSVACCGQERCDGSVCNQCVAACLQRAAPTNNQFSALKSQCQAMIQQGFRRL